MRLLHFIDRNISGHRLLPSGGLLHVFRAGADYPHRSPLIRAAVIAVALLCGGLAASACEVPVSVPPTSPAYIAHPHVTPSSQCVIESFANGGSPITAADPPWSTATEWTVGDPGSGSVLDVPCADRSFITVNGKTYWLPGMVEKFVNIPST